MLRLGGPNPKSPPPPHTHIFSANTDQEYERSSSVPPAPALRTPGKFKTRCGCLPRGGGGLPPAPQLPPSKESPSKKDDQSIRHLWRSRAQTLLATRRPREDFGHESGRIATPAALVTRKKRETDSKERKKGAAGIPWSGRNKVAQEPGQSEAPRASDWLFGCLNSPLPLKKKLGPRSAGVLVASEEGKRETAGRLNQGSGL